MVKRIVVTGSREWEDRDVIRLAILDAADGHPFTIIVGDCPSGADRLTRLLCDAHDWEYKEYKADWRRLGKGAGVARNQVMADAGGDVCLAFFWSAASNTGTADCAGRCEQAGLEMRRYQG